MTTQQAIPSFDGIAMAVVAVFEPQGDVNLLTKPLGVSVVQSPSVHHHTAQACKLHCPPVLVTQVNDSHTTLLATDSFCLFQQCLGQSSTTHTQLFLQASDDTAAADIGAKTCSVCRVEKPYSAYWRRAAAQDGLQLVCKVCQKLQGNQLRQDRKLWPPSTGLLPCAVCDHLKDTKHFSRCIGTMNGVQYECRACAAKRLADVYLQSKLADRQPVAHKVCFACQKQKPAEAFHRHFASNSGLQSSCKQCQLHRQRLARQQRRQNAHMTQNLA